MGAWGIRRRWNANDATELANQARRLTAKTVLAGLRRYTCEDLLLAHLIEYARLHGLPVRIRNGKGVCDSNDHYGDWVSFRDKVLKTTGASDLARPENSIRVGVGRMSPIYKPGATPPSDLNATEQIENQHVRTQQLPMMARAQPGMLLLHGEPGKVYHCQLVSGRVGNRVQIWQGNFRYVDRRSISGETTSGTRVHDLWSCSRRPSEVDRRIVSDQATATPRSGPLTGEPRAIRGLARARLARAAIPVAASSSTEAGHRLDRVGDRGVG